MVDGMLYSQNVVVRYPPTTYISYTMCLRSQLPPAATSSLVPANPLQIDLCSLFPLLPLLKGIQPVSNQSS